MLDSKNPGSLSCASESSCSVQVVKTVTSTLSNSKDKLKIEVVGEDASDGSVQEQEDADDSSEHEREEGHRITRKYDLGCWYDFPHF